MPPHLRPMFVYRPTAEGHEWNGYSTLYTIGEAMQEFLASPSALGGKSNGEVLESVVGASIGKPAWKVVDPATYDGASGRHGQKCRTFEEAFRACCVSYDQWGHRDWRDFDLRTLQDCHSDFRVFRVPEWVEEMLIEESLAAEYERARDEHEYLETFGTGDAGDDEIPF